MAAELHRNPAGMAAIILFIAMCHMLSLIGRSVCGGGYGFAPKLNCLMSKGIINSPLGTDAK